MRIHVQPCHPTCSFLEANINAQGYYSEMWAKCHLRFVHLEKPIYSTQTCHPQFIVLNWSCGCPDAEAQLVKAAHPCLFLLHITFWPLLFWYNTHKGWHLSFFFFKHYIRSYSNMSSSRKVFIITPGLVMLTLYESRQTLFNFIWVGIHSGTRSVEYILRCWWQVDGGHSLFLPLRQLV